MKEFLDKAATAYYEGQPIISDEEFDRLAELYYYDRVGNPQAGGPPHAFRMYSLRKLYKGVDEMPSNIKDYYQTPKLDGSAVCITYVDGTLVRAATRGDGIRSDKDLTDKFVAWSIIPNFIEDAPSLVQVSGEVAAPFGISNPRNYAAGALGLKEVSAFLEKEINFFAYSVQPHHKFKSFSAELNLLESWGFITVDDPTVFNYPQDGEVYRLHSNEAYICEGFTSHHPRGAFALKTRKAGVQSKLLGVTWQVGKSGKVSPVAELEPIEIDGATISRATLHNIKYIEDLELEIGCNVEVIRSGDIIPRVVRRV